MIYIFISPNLSWTIIIDARCLAIIGKHKHIGWQIYIPALFPIHCHMAMGLIVGGGSITCVAMGNCGISATQKHILQTTYKEQSSEICHLIGEHNPLLLIWFTVCFLVCCKDFHHPLYH